MFFMSKEDQNSDHDREMHAKDSLAVNAGLEAFFFFFFFFLGGWGRPKLFVF